MVSETVVVVLRGALIAVVPTLSMMMTSLFTVSVKLSSEIESSSQNFCAGLILGAVAQELFPQVVAHNESETSIIGISLGFVVGIFLLIGIDYFVSLFESADGGEGETYYSGESGASNYHSDQTRTETKPMSRHESYDSLSTTNSNNREHIADPEEEAAAETNPAFLLASQAISSPGHRELIKLKVKALCNSLAKIEQKANALAVTDGSSSRKTDGLQQPEDSKHGDGSFGDHTSANEDTEYGYLLDDNNHSSYQHMQAVHESGAGVPHASLLHAEMHADQIDEAIHKLQYEIDHCKRLVQGTGSNVVGVLPRVWITARGKEALQVGLRDLQRQAEFISRSLAEDDFNSHGSKASLINILKRFDAMDNKIHSLHNTVDRFSITWRRRGKKIPMPSSGSLVPLSLMLPVCVDCIVDGFLMGSSSAFRFHAGLILGFANAIEMGFLGLAVAMHVQKCTGSSAFVRYSAMIAPPFLMLFAAALGAFAGNAATVHPTVYVGFVSVGIVALLYLAVNELLVEAREAQQGKDTWWGPLVVFLGVYCVLILDLIMPE